MSVRRSYSGEEIHCGLREENPRLLGNNTACEESKGKILFKQRKFFWSVSKGGDQDLIYKENNLKKIARMVHMVLYGK